VGGVRRIGGVAWGRGERGGKRGGGGPFVLSPCRLGKGGGCFRGGGRGCGGEKKSWGDLFFWEEVGVGRGWVGE